MLFGELVRDAELGIHVIVASEQATDRTVRTGIITDLPDPSRFLQPDALVLTTALWSTRDDGAKVFVEAVAASGAAALVISLAELGVVPDLVVELCRAAGLTLATAGPDMEFGALVDRIKAAQPDSTSTLERQGAGLRSRLARSSSLADALVISLDATGANTWLLGTSGAVLASAAEPPDPALVGELWNHLLSGRPGHAAEGFRGRDVTPILGWGAGPVAYLIAEPGKTHPLLSSLVTHLESWLSLTGERERAERHAVANLFDSVLSGTATDGETAARLRLAGLDPALPLVVVTGLVDDATWPPEATRRLLLETVTAEGEGEGACAALREACVVIVTSPVDAQTLRERLDDAAPMLAGRRLRIGLSDTLDGVRDLGNAISAATVRMQAVDGDGPLLIADRSTALTHRDLLAQFAGSVRASYAQDVLAPLVEYDEKNGGDLLATLRLFLDNNGAWVETARMLDLHPNTMRYRMSRVEDLTNRDLTRMEDRVDLFLALACLDF